MKKVCEDVKLKLNELLTDMAKEVAQIDRNYSSLSMKVDIIANVVTKVVELYNSLVPKLGSKSKFDGQCIAKIEELLGNFKELVSNLGALS